MIVQFCENTKNHRVVHFKRVTFIVCELYLNFKNTHHTHTHTHTQSHSGELWLARGNALLSGQTSSRAGPVSGASGIGAQVQPRLCSRK